MYGLFTLIREKYGNCHADTLGYMTYPEAQRSFERFFRWGYSVALICDGWLIENAVYDYEE